MWTPNSFWKWSLFPWFLLLTLGLIQPLFAIPPQNKKLNTAPVKKPPPKIEFAAPAGIQYQLEKSFEGVDLRIQKGNWLSTGQIGAYPVVIELTNRHLKPTRLSIEILFRQEHHFKREITLKGGENRNLEIPIPYYLNRPTTLRISSTQSEMEFTFTGESSYQHNRQKPNLLLIGNRFPIFSLNEYNSSRKSHWNQGANYFIANPDQLPNSFWPYLSFNLTLLDDQTFQYLTDSAKNNLLSWVAFGGTLCLYGPQAQETSQKFFKFSLDSLRKVPGSFKENYISHLRGHIITLEEDPFEEDKTEWEERLEKRWLPYLIQWENQLFTQKPEMTEPLHQLPLFALFLFFTLMVVLTGPLNFWVLKKNKLDNLFVLTVPFFSIISVGGLLIFLFFYQGFAHSGRIYSLVLDHPPTKTQYRISWNNIFFSGWKNPNSTLQPQCAFFPFPNLKKYYGSLPTYQMRGVQVSGEEELTLAPNWAESREIANLVTLEAEDRVSLIDFSLSPEGDILSGTNKTPRILTSILVFYPPLGGYAHLGLEPIMPGETFRLSRKDFHEKWGSYFPYPMGFPLTYSIFSNLYPIAPFYLAKSSGKKGETWPELPTKKIETLVNELEIMGSIDVLH